MPRVKLRHKASIRKSKPSTTKLRGGTPITSVMYRAKSLLQRFVSLPIYIRLGLVTALLLILTFSGLQLRHYQLYAVSAASRQLLSKSSIDTSKIKASSKAISYDASQNPTLKKDATIGAATEATGKTGYQATINTDFHQGLTFGDSNSQLSFQMTPLFDASGGQYSEGQIMFPVSSGTKVFQTFKKNGIKEDIVLSGAPGKTATWQWKLGLGDKLSAKLLPDGSVGIYDADPHLDSVLIDNAKFQAQTSDNRHLVFIIPAPVIKDSLGHTLQEDVSFSLSGDTLTLEARNLITKHYPISIDPSVLMSTAATTADDATVGTVAWTNPNNAQASDGVYATSLVSGSSDNTHYLKATNFGFSIPTGAIINGILVEVQKMSNNGTPGANTKDSAVRIVKSNGTFGVTNKADTVTRWSSVEAYTSYPATGGSTDLWGETWTAADINNSNFGVGFSALLSDVSLSNTVASIDHIRITVYYTVPPAAPTLSAPASGATSVSLTPLFQLKTTHATSTYAQYKILVYQSDCSTLVRTIDQTASQTGWSGQDAQTSTAYVLGATLGASTLASHTYQAAALSATTTYCWKGAGIDPGGSNTFGAYSATQLFTIGTSNQSPVAPTLSQPSSGQIGVLTTPEFRVYTTDPDNDYVQYKILVYQSDCATLVRTIDQTASQTGWLGQSQQTSTAYSSGQTAIHDYQLAALSINTTYCWKAAALDPAGSNTFGSYSTTSLFTTETSATLDQIYINGNINIHGNITIHP